MSTTSNAPRPTRYLPVLALVFLVLTAALIAGYFLVLKKDYAVLSEDLRPADASAVVEELKKQQVDYRLGDGGANILVPASQVDAVRLSLAGSDLSVKGLDGFELFNSSDMGLTDFTQKIKYQRALQGELARTILMLHDVVEARVHIAMPERALFRGEQSRPKAAVTLITRSPAAETSAQVQGVQQLVAAAIPDLEAANVVVLNGRGEVISARIEREGPTGPSSDTALDARSSELVSAMMGRILPGRRFEIHIELEPESSGDVLATGETGAAATDGLPLRAASEQQRTVLIASSTAISEVEQQRVLSELFATGEILKQSRDSVRFEVRPVHTPVVVQSASKPNDEEIVPSQDVGDKQTYTSPTSMKIDFGPIAWMVGGLAVLSLVAVLGFALLRRSRTLLSVEDQKRFVDQLRLGLELNANGGEGGQA